MIIRGKRQTNYTILSNVGLEDTRLTFKAKGLLAYLLSKPDGWMVSDRQLATVGPDGRDAVQTALRELESFGYLVRRRENGAGGKWIHHSYIYDEPQVAGETAVEASATMAGKTVHGRTVAGKTVHGKTVHGKSRHIVSTVGASTDPASTEEAKTVGEDATPAAIASDATPTPSQPAIEAKETPKEPTPQQAMFQALCDAVGWDPALLTVDQRGQVAQVMATLSKAGYSVEDVRRFHADVWAHDWRWTKNHSYPTLKQVREEIAKVRRERIGAGGKADGTNSKRTPRFGGGGQRHEGLAGDAAGSNGATEPAAVTDAGLPDLPGRRLGLPQRAAQRSGVGQGASVPVQA